MKILRNPRFQIAIKAHSPFFHARKSPGLEPRFRAAAGIASQQNGHNPLNDRLISAVKLKNHEAVKALVAEGAEINAPGETGLRPLHFAVNSKNPEMIRLVRQLGAHPDAVTEKGITALHWASALTEPEGRKRAKGEKPDELEILTALFDETCGRKPDIDAQNIWQETALHICAHHKWEKGAAFLISQGASALFRDIKGLTPYKRALTFSADLEWYNEDGKTADPPRAPNNILILLQRHHEAEAPDILGC